MEHGFVDRITERSELKKVLADLCRMHDREGCKKALCQLVDTEMPEDAKRNPAACLVLEQKESESAWEHVLAARRADRPDRLPDSFLHLPAFLYQMCIRDSSLS